MVWDLSSSCRSVLFRPLLHLQALLLTRRWVGSRTRERRSRRVYSFFGGHTSKGTPAMYAGSCRRTDLYPLSPTRAEGPGTECATTLINVEGGSQTPKTQSLQGEHLKWPIGPEDTDTVKDFTG